MQRHLRLIPCKTPADVDSLLSRLTIESASGELAGMLTVVFYKGQSYEAHVAGEAIMNPTFARGALLALDDYLSALVHEQPS